MIRLSRKDKKRVVKTSDMLLMRAGDKQSLAQEAVNSTAVSAGGVHNTEAETNKTSKAHRNCCIILICVLMLFVSAFGVISLVDENQTISEREQRNLTEFPVLTLKGYLDGSCYQQFNSAYSDTFPFRDFWLDSYNFIKETVTVTIGDEQVIDVADDDSGAEDDEETKKKQAELLALPFDSTGYEQFQGDISTSSSSVSVENGRAHYIFNGTIKAAENYVNYMKSLQQKLPNNRIITLLLPDSGAFYASEKYSTGKHDVKAWLEMVDKNLTGITNIKVYDTLYEHKDEYIYYRTDHHWTALGAYYAYQQLCKELGLYCYDINYLEQGKVTGFLGSFYNKTSSSTLKNNPDEVYYYRPIYDVTIEAYTDRSEFDKLRSIKLINEKVTASNKYTLFINGDNPLSYVTTTCPSGKSIVVIKDSYANCLIPLLCNNYTNIYIVDPRHMNSTSSNQFNLVDFLADKGECDILFVCYAVTANKSNRSSGTYMNGLLKLL